MYNNVVYFKNLNQKNLKKTKTENFHLKIGVLQTILIVLN